ncbi:MAG: hypothetical protein DYG89_13970 [Caldilinea sp. CFX5]|nr:hypothetical protein [Caldilinea sp. CFX5]
MSNDSIVSYTLWHFLIDLATDPQRQAKMAGLTVDELQQMLINEGMSEEEAHLLANAQRDETGRQQLIDYLGGTIVCWNVHHHHHNG